MSSQRITRKQGDRVLSRLARWVGKESGAPDPLPPDYDLVEHMRQGSAYKYDPTRIARVRQDTVESEHGEESGASS